MGEGKAQVRGDPTVWLLGEDNPSVRYLTLCYLLDRPEDDPEVEATRAAIPRSRVVERIFGRQAPGGFWGDPASPYQPKYKASLLWHHLPPGGFRRDSRGQATASGGGSCGTWGRVPPDAPPLPGRPP
jgi:hypothetical protein